MYKRTISVLAARPKSAPDLLRILLRPLSCLAFFTSRLLLGAFVLVALVLLDPLDFWVVPGFDPLQNAIAPF